MSWIGLGQGSGMAGANIFMVYADASGTNVTLSPRLGKGQFQPDYTSSTQATLLAGSGIANGVMTANVRCDSCQSWNGGSMSVKSSSSNWIWAHRSGDAINSNDKSENLMQHNDAEPFHFDLTTATGGNSANPFLNAATATSPSSSGSSMGSSPSSPPSSGGSSSGSGSMGSSGGSAAEAKQHKIALTHGVIMSIAFVAFFPAGALLVRLFSLSIWYHAGIQLFAYALAITGLGLGAWLVVAEGALHQSAHPIIGIVVISMLLLQPITGLIHHAIYKKKQSRTAFAIMHLWYGRALLILGLINGGLGLQLSGNKMGEIGYGVCAGVVGVFWIAVVVWTAVRGTSRDSGLKREEREKYSPSDETVLGGSGSGGGSPEGSMEAGTAGGLGGDRGRERERSRRNTRDL